MSFYIVIPARYGSSRLPGKPLLDIAGKPMVQHVYERACQRQARRVVIATDDTRIAAAVKAFGGEVCMTDASHASGTDRLQEVSQHYGLEDDAIIVNVQGDEPLIAPDLIDQVANNLANNLTASVATLCEPIDNVEDFLDPNIVKVVVDKNAFALYFSRAPIPWPRDAFARTQAALPDTLKPQRHIGIYAYRAGLLNRYITWPVSPLEAQESLEQLRVLWHGETIHVDQANCPVPGGVDTEADLLRVRQLIEGTSVN